MDAIGFGLKWQKLGMFLRKQDLARVIRADIRISKYKEWERVIDKACNLVLLTGAVAITMELLWLYH